MREMRATQQSRDLNLAIVLISSVVMFLCCHIPRLITSVYEAANIHSILHCREQGMDKTPLWFMYVTATVQLLMVRLRPLTLNCVLFPRDIHLILTNPLNFEGAITFNHFYKT